MQGAGVGLALKLAVQPSCCSYQVLVGRVTTGPAVQSGHRSGVGSSLQRMSTFRWYSLVLLLTQGLNPRLLHRLWLLKWQADSLILHHLVGPINNLDGDFQNDTHQIGISKVT